MVLERNPGRHSRDDGMRERQQLVRRRAVQSSQQREAQAV